MPWFLDEPQSDLTSLDNPANPNGGASQYGAFIFPEYLHQVTGGPAIIRETWEAMATKDGFRAIESALAARGTSATNIVPGFWRSAYLLDFDIPGLIEPATLTAWRDSLIALSTTRHGEDPVDTTPRMGTRPITLSDGSTESGSFELGQGGAAALEIKPLTAGEVTVDIEGSHANLDVKVLQFSDYPVSCAPEQSVVAPDGRNFTTTLTLSGSCVSATVLITHKQVDALTNTTVNWRAGFTTTGAAIIDNGTIRLGINPEGHLNVPFGFGYLGLEYMPTGGDAVSPGCLCEGWGVADLVSGTSGWGVFPTEVGHAAVVRL